MAKQKKMDEKTASVAQAIQEGVLADRARSRETYAQFQQVVGIRETTDGVSFFDDDLDTEALDAVVAGITD